MNHRMEQRNELSDAALRAAAERLGRDAAARFDVDRAARGVAAQLRESRAAARWTWRRAASHRLAAAVVLLLGGLLLLRERRHNAVPLVTLPANVELADLGASDLEQLLGAMDQDLRLDSLPRSTGELDDLTLDDLTADQLQLVLRSLEG